MVGKILADFFGLAIEGTAAVSRRLALLGKPTPEDGTSPQTQAAKVYLRSLRRLVLVTLFFPVPILVLGIIGGLGWLIAIVGIFWALCTLALSFVVAPLGLLLKGLLGGLKGIGERYVKFVLGALLVELSFTLFVAVFPIKNNIAALPIILIAAFILGILEARGANTIFSKKFIAGKASTILAVFTLSLFFPQSFGALRGATQNIDKQATKVLRGETSVKKLLGDRESIDRERIEQAEQSYTFPDGENQIKVPLDAGRWSRRVEFPEDAVRFKAVTPPGKRIEIKDWRGKVYDGSGWPWIQADIAHKVIRLSGEDTAMVTIERR